MRRRLLLVLLPLVALLLAALGTLYAHAYAGARTQERYAGLLARAQAVATQAEPSLRQGFATDRVRKLAEAYSTYFGYQLVIFDRRLDEYLDTRRRAVADRREIATARATLDGEAQRSPATAWPWRTEPLVVGVPVGSGSGTIGAVVALASTADERRDVARALAELGAGGALVLVLVAAVVVLPLARWILRPVGELAGAARRISSGDHAARVPERSGPPELRGLAATFNAMAAAVGTALDRQRAFAADASHQLRNPLTALRLRLDNAALHVEPAGECELRAALEEVDRLTRTIDALLRLARSEATASELRSVDVGQLVRDRVAEAAAAFAAAGARLACDVEGAAIARCNATAVEQALDALLDNARKFGRDGAVDVSVTSRDGEVRIRVRDRGAGLPADELVRATERFWRSPRHQNVDGTGLGLTIARALLEGAGGRLELRVARPGLAVDIVLPAVH